jgi:Chaperone of endosialidase
MSLIPIHGFDIEGPTSAPTVLPDRANGNMAAGTYRYKVSYVNRYGETLAGPASSSVVINTGSALLTNLPVHPLGNVVSRRIYRTSVGSTLPFRLIGVLGDNITPTFTDIDSDASLGVVEPANNFAPSVGIERGWTVLSRPSIHPFDVTIVAAGSNYSTATRCSQLGEIFFVNVPVNLAGIILPPVTAELAGMIITVKNISGANQLNVYPESPTGQINAGGVGVSRVLQPGVSEEFIAFSPTSWQVLSTTGGASGVSTISGGTTGLTPTVPSGGAVTIGGTLVVANGGTGLTSVASGAIIYGSGTAPLSSTVGTTGQLLVSGGGLAPVWSGTIIYNGTTISGIPVPANPGDIVSKGYVDALTTGFNVHTPVRLATTAALTVLYSNGAMGVGATLTNNGALAPLQIDSTPVTPGMRVLVKNQASSIQNGVYDVTTVGTGLVPWVLVRSSDFDNSPVGEVVAGDFVFTEIGPTNAGTGWVQTQVGSGGGGALIIGVDPLLFTQFSSAGGYLAGTGLNLLGNTFSNTGVLTVSGGTTGLLFSPTSGNAVLSGTLAVANGGTGSTGGIDIVLDSGASPTYPQNLTSGVWYGIGTKAAGNAGSVRIGNGASAVGSDSVAIGLSATSGATATIALGRNAKGGISLGNISIGDNAGSNTAGANNIAIGVNAISSGTATGSQNVSVGTGSLGALTSGSDNASLGYNALVSITTGSGNIALGSTSGTGLTTGGGNVLVGNNTTTDTAARSNAVVLGNGVTSLSAAGAHDGGLYSRHFAGVVSGNAAVWVGNELCEATSSQRYKENIRALEDVTEQFMKLEPVRYVGKEDPEKIEQIGMIAEHVEKLFPEFVVYKTDEENKILPHGLVYDRMVVLLVQQVQKLTAEVETLKAERKGKGE